jgi:hypothetical protein
MLQEPRDPTPCRELLELLSSMGRHTAAAQVRAWQAFTARPTSGTQRSADSSPSFLIDNPEVVGTVLDCSGPNSCSAPAGPATTLGVLDSVRFWDRLELPAGSRVTLLLETESEAPALVLSGPRSLSFDAAPTAGTRSGAGPAPDASRGPAQPPDSRTPAQAAASSLIHLASDTILRAAPGGDERFRPLWPGQFCSARRPAIGWVLFQQPPAGSAVAVSLGGFKVHPSVTPAGKGLQVSPYPASWPDLQPGERYSLTLELRQPGEGSSPAPRRFVRQFELLEEEDVAEFQQRVQARARTAGPQALGALKTWLEADELVRLGCYEEALLLLMPSRAWPGAGPHRRPLLEALAARLGIPLDCVSGTHSTGP